MLTLGPTVRRPVPGAPGFYMRVNDGLTSSVLFLGIADDRPGKGGIEPIGTGFLVSYQNVGYLVTARHVAKDLDNQPFRMRINKIDGGTDNLDADELEWTYHPDPDVDAAAITFHAGQSFGWDCVFIPDDLLFDHVLQVGEGIGIGDICYTIGLFRVLAGQERNLPVVHTGNLALIPGSEKIPILDWDDPQQKRVRHVEGYLVEMHTLSGLSGSPVFVRPVIDSMVKGAVHGDMVGARLPRHQIYLLGIWQGAWQAPASEVLALEHGRPVTVPVGMGIVVPSVRIREILEMPKLREQREQAKAAGHYPAAPQSVPRSAPATNPDENPDHREDFNRLVGEASKSKPKGGRT